MDHTFGIRLQFDCLGSRQCTGSLSEVWKPMKSFGNLFFLGSRGQQMLVSRSTVVFKRCIFLVDINNLKCGGG